MGLKRLRTTAQPQDRVKGPGLSQCLPQVEQMFALTPMDLAGNIDYKSLCYIITHGDEKEE